MARQYQLFTSVEHNFTSLLYNQISAAENAPDEKQVLTEIARLWGGDSKTQKRALSPPRSLSPESLLQLNESPSRMRMAAE